MNAIITSHVISGDTIVCNVSHVASLLLCTPPTTATQTSMIINDKMNAIKYMFTIGRVDSQTLKFSVIIKSQSPTRCLNLQIRNENSISSGVHVRCGREI